MGSSLLYLWSCKCAVRVKRMMSCLPEYPNPQKCENIGIDEEIVFCLFLVEREVQMRRKSVEMSSSKSVDVILPRVVLYSTQGRKTPDPLDTEGKGIVEIFDDHQGDRLGWCSSERDKHDVLYSVYGRTNVRFEP